MNQIISLKLKIAIAAIIILISSSVAKAQKDRIITIFGKITDPKGAPIEMVSVTVPGFNVHTITQKDGTYSIKVPNVNKFINFRCLGYETKEIYLSRINLPDSVIINPIEANGTLKPSVEELNQVLVTGKHRRTDDLISIKPKTISVLPDASMSGVEASIKTLPGVFSRNELSSQYSVRGGNFDENLVYVNDIEVYRPFLIRSGQQEGLSFINPDMVSSISFSNGGFDAKYGDKMSSVLDIKYKKPDGFGASVSGSFLGGTAHFEGISKNSRFTYITGIRYKTSKYLLGSLETEGEYTPSYTDVQTYLTYDVTKKFELSFLGNYSINQYNFEPVSRNTSFGTMQDAVNLNIYFDGQEIDRFLTTTGAIAGSYSPRKNLNLKFIASVFNTKEEETFDIDGMYWLNMLDKQLGGGLGDSTQNIGLGHYIDHARNFLDGQVLNLSHKGQFTAKGEKHHVLWGLKFQHEEFDDEITEWMLLDSAGYSLPNSDSEVKLNRYVNADNKILSNRFTSYIQDTYKFKVDSADFTLSAGLRFSLWDFNNELLVSPRMRLSFQPNWVRNFLFRFSTGVYYQPPFYKELRDFNGVINEEISSQKSIHFVLGSDYKFMMWDRPFTLITEVYYKKLEDLIPYMVDNVRIKYYAFDRADGFATGIDMKINGEFVEGVDSWASLSFLKTKEDIHGDGYGNIPRPTDQFISAGLFFQDYLPNNDTYKMHLNLLFGTGLPTGPPSWGRHKATKRMPSYKRVDLGFSKQLISENSKFSQGSILNHIKSLWLGLEVFNLLDVSNTVSYLWVTVVPNRSVAFNDSYHQYAVPNRLTSRRINLKMVAKF